MSTKLFAVVFIPAAIWSQTTELDRRLEPTGELDGRSSGPPRREAEFPRPNGAAQLSIPEFTSREQDRPISGVVSIHELEHPVPKKAMQAFREAARYSREHNPAKAIEKLEQAVRIDPLFKEAQTNLGAQYVRAARLDEAVPHFQKAYEAGPPDPITCTNLAWAYYHLGQFRDAETMARKALELDPGNPKAEKILRYAAMR